ncbi:aldehyde dehydrogenase family protein [Mycobacterium sp. Y57]|uniref:aldehyde dehydrogenase family protein n=1 Tax=Mycolicibacterium xanthum TaxID=2796469 RepID=UPI001C852A27|nr:aldehyde dehydrogenase family protein [Mycolicibacterium xanthum]MBX7430502.1 aldehyde dehydrogenase family protein [Mycolicibacterium xanthum]
MTYEGHMTIGGKPVTGDEWVSVPNPAHLSAVVGRYPQGTIEHVEQAVEAASSAFPDWRATPVAERAALLAQAGALLAQPRDEWVSLLTAENGKLLREAVIDIAMGGEAISVYASHPEWTQDRVVDDERGRLVVRKQPLGVCVGIVPWNFPLTLASLKVGPALLAGNTLIIKVPEFAPLTTLRALGEMAALLPPGVLNIVSGYGPEVGRALVTHPKVRKIAFTGSTETGRQIMADASGHLARLTLELGGNDAAVLLDDVDLSDEAIGRIVTGAFMYSGQICIDIKRLYVHESRYDELVDRLSVAVDKIVVGDGARPEVTMGPINNARQYDKVTKLLAETKRDADCVQLGSYADGTDVEDGYFLLPHLVLDPPDEMKVVATEQMAPILPVMKFSSDEEAVTRANGTEYGLGASVWSSDRDRAFSVADRMEAGMTFINGHSLFALHPDAPAGGAKQSGHGYEMSQEALEGYTQLQAITNTYTQL